MRTHNLSNLWSSIIIDELIKSEVIDFYISPGMRCAPLVNSLIENSKAKLYVGIDERAQAYRALGCSKATGRTSALICTSGTALANYLPALIEAKKSAVPLIVLSADRPVELALSDANQTIDQNKFYSQHVMADACLGAPTEQIAPSVIRNTINHLLFRSMYPNKGPVHFNIPLREPLDDSVTPISKEYLDQSQKSFNRTIQTDYYGPIQSLSNDLIDKVSAIVSNTKNGILVIGSLPNSMCKESVRKLIDKLNWPMHLDVSSSLKFSYSLNDKIIPTFDHPEVYENISKNLPSTIIHLGGRTTSKHYYRLLEENPSIEYITVNWSEQKEDPAQSVDLRIVSHVDQFCTQLCERIENSSSLLEIDFTNFVKKKIELIEESEISYPVLSKKIIENIRDNSSLYISNSTVVRSFDNYISQATTKSLDIFTNRGVSGIEGLLASAIGSAEGSEKYTTLVVGDISLLHDLNSLQMLKTSKQNLCIIVVNNFGGGIFTLLPIAKNQQLLPYLTTPHQVNFENAAKMFDLDYHKVDNTSDFLDCYLKAQEHMSKVIIEVTIDNEKNVELYKTLKTLKL
ncbi:2-succinyl-5-enolpyruvyl-6-hydroxy-3-cyclohexene-1-carboxylic-acid synthase [Halobacteriovorax sp. HLS]|uniref:2-succinyl-5-enolpyruvyl-6-hydroxy-3- cyclohexene-1-carboxylic-acid synthase n=1 Tax=Halobacteriovorax sp. HLS TaxID=2234000 RepID=UPI000FDB6329|nr:2-succinyl-5-enolpyruvyl-6-hydroxy-3-cyclohexene-1-carboxylic-acid synthase [Halobacteriovorax sp. HLS]